MPTLLSLPMELLQVVLPPDTQTRAGLATTNSRFRDLARRDPGAWYFPDPHLRLDGPQRHRAFLSMAPLQLPHTTIATVHMPLDVGMQSCLVSTLVRVAPRLRHLQLVDQTPLALEVAAMHLARLEGLEALELYLDIAPDGESEEPLPLSLTCLTSLRALEKLALDSDNPQADCVLRLEAADQLPASVTSLVLDNLNLQALPPLTPTLRELRLGNTFVHDETGVSSLSQLTSLRYTPFNRVELHSLPTSLQRLHVDFADWQWYGMQPNPAAGDLQSFNLPALTRLQHLNLSRVTPTNGAALISQLTGLTSLSLCPFGPADVRFLDCSFPRLVRLILDVCTPWGRPPYLPAAPLLETLLLSNKENLKAERNNMRMAIALPAELGLPRYPALRTLVLHKLDMVHTCDIPIPNVFLLNCTHPPNVFPHFQSLSLDDVSDFTFADHL